MIILNQSYFFCRNASKVIVNYTDSSSNSSDESDKTPMKQINRTRKRKRNPQTWKRTQRKENYQRGQQYISAKGKTIQAKRIDESKNCLRSCRYHCTKNFDPELRTDVKNSFYSLEQNGKSAFLLNMTRRILIKRKRSAESNYKSFSFEYFFEKDNEKVRVCKPFFLATLCISQKPVYNVHMKKSDTGTPQADKRGKNTKDRILQKDKDLIKQHIESFPCVEAHYCRKDSKKKYLEPSLNVQKMYDLYVDLCNEQQITPQKVSLYRHIFNFNFNLEFLQPKTDRCDICEEYRLAKKEKRVNQEMDLEYQSHISRKMIMRGEREKDRENKNPNCAVVCFDLENVINLPKSDVSVLFYKQKLNVYNLTAHSSVGKEVYCAIWPETMCGRSGNDISSALIQILEKIISKHPQIIEIITWSDSCVPQNRNSLVSVAIADFLNRHSNILRVTMKYSIPGHSCIQVVDNVHSRIEKAMMVADIWSPLSFMRLLLKVDRRKSFSIINMKQDYFKNFKKTALNYKYDQIPYTKVCQLRFVQGEQYIVQFKENVHNSDFVSVNVNIKTAKRSKTLTVQSNLDKLVIAPADKIKNKTLTEKKIQQIEFAYKWMPKDDQEYMRALISEFKR